MTDPVTRCWVVSGRVQGVGFRWFARLEAQRMGVAGWVRNLADGSVEVVARAEPPVLDRLEAALRQGPPHARIDGFDTSEVPQEPVDSKSFIVKH